MECGNSDLMITAMDINLYKFNMLSEINNSEFTDLIAKRTTSRWLFHITYQRITLIRLS